MLVFDVKNRLTVVGDVPDNKNYKAGKDFCGGLPSGDHCYIILLLNILTYISHVEMVYQATYIQKCLWNSLWRTNKYLITPSYASQAR